MKIEFSSQRREMLLFLTTNMAAVRSRANQQLQVKLPQHVAATPRSNKSLRVYWRNFVKIFVFATEFCRRDKSHKILSDLIFCNLLLRQNSVGENPKIL